MNEKRKFNLDQYRSQPGSRWQLIKLIFYGLCLLFLGWLLYSKFQELNTEIPPNNKEIHDVEIEISGD